MSNDITINFTAVPVPVTITITGQASEVIPTGSRLTGYWTTAPAGYVLLKGETIGSVASGATHTTDTQALFTLLWNSVSDTYCPVSTGRGASAAADYAANKTLTLLDERLRIPAMLNAADTLAGVTAEMGAIGGEETHQLIVGETPALQTSYATAGAGVAAVTQYAFPGLAHNNVQPFICVNVAIKL